MKNTPPNATGAGPQLRVGPFGVTGGLLGGQMENLALMIC